MKYFYDYYYFLICILKLDYLRSSMINDYLFISKFQMIRNACITGTYISIFHLMMDSMSTNY